MCVRNRESTGNGADLFHNSISPYSVEGVQKSLRMC
jgi:hypothetical protein